MIFDGESSAPLPDLKVRKLKKIEIFDIFQISLKLGPGGSRTFKTSKNYENSDLGASKIEKN